MKYLITILLFTSLSAVQAQLSIVSSSPAANSTSVPLATSISITFSAALDTTYTFGDEYGIFWNLGSASPCYYSPDHRTATFDAVLLPDKVYIVSVFYARAEGGATLQSPFNFIFTTGSTFPPFTVGGNVLSGSTGVSPANALVILSSTPISVGEPNAVSVAIADGSGAFVLPYVANGTYYPVAAKDVNGDGGINPEAGDVVAIGDSITVINGNISGINLTFANIPALSFHEAVHLADSINATLPPGNTLRQVGSWDVDTLGRGEGWEFRYLNDSQPGGYRIHVGGIERRVENLDSMSAWWLANSRVLVNPGSAAASSLFLTNIENSGGREFRTQNPGGNLLFQSELTLGDLRWSQFGWLVPDTSLNYWGASYSWGYDSSHQWNSIYSKSFIGDFSNGNIIVVTDVKTVDKGPLPTETALSQNYPNPFNPSTQIRFSAPREEWTTLKVYNLIGQEVATLVQGLVPAGEYTVRFDANGLTSGVYFYRLTAGAHVVTNRMILMK